MSTCHPDDIVQLVDAIEESPNVLVDFNSSPLFYSDWEAPPPPNDGPIYLATSHSGRVISFNVNVEKQSDANDVAAALQPALQYISRGEVWLKFQKSGAVDPVFFKLRRSSVTAIQEFFEIRPGSARTITLSLNADPFAEGLAVTHVFTITNNPAASGIDLHPMQYELPPIAGDVLAPVYFKFPTANALHKIKWASEASFYDDLPSEPYYKSLATATKDATPATGWTINDIADAGAIGTNRRVLVKSGGDRFMVPTSAAVLPWDDLPPGDYRVFVRAMSADLDTKLMFFNRPPTVGSVLTEDDAVTWTTAGPTPTASGHRDWFDLGVAAMPGGSPISDVMYNLDPIPDSALWNVAVATDAASLTMGLDAIMLVPAGRAGTITRHGGASFTDDFTDKTAIIDGINSRRYAKGTSALDPTSTVTTLPALEMHGALPVVVPRAQNTLTFFADTAYYDATRVNDDKTLTTLIELIYHPRYLNDRPDAT